MGATTCHSLHWTTKVQNEASLAVVSYAIIINRELPTCFYFGTRGIKRPCNHHFLKFATFFSDFHSLCNGQFRKLCRNSKWTNHLVITYTCTNRVLSKPPSNLLQNFKVFFVFCFCYSNCENCLNALHKQERNLKDIRNMAGRKYIWLENDKKKFQHIRLQV